MLPINSVVCGDSLDVLKTFPDKSVNCVITSPPYFRMRDYGIDGQIGLEQTPDEYVQKITKVFNEVKRILFDDGTLWLNIGDSYGRFGGDMFTQLGGERHAETFKNLPNKKLNTEINFPPPKNLLGIPWRIAFALQNDGWYLRQDIIWHKKNPMPEMTKDRCTRSHEYIFLMAKSSKYYFDADAIKEPILDATKKRYEYGWNGAFKGQFKGSPDETRFQEGKPIAPGEMYKSDFRNKRSVWTTSLKPFKEAHFATFPPDLIEPCVLAGCPEGGIILDPFMGSGTTALVALKNYRKYVGIDISEEYCNMARKRIELSQKQITIFDYYYGAEK